MAKSKALNDAEQAIREAGESACAALGLPARAYVTGFSAGPAVPALSFLEKVVLLAALPAESRLSNDLRRHLFEFVPEPIGAPDRREAKHEGPRRTKAAG